MDYPEPQTIPEYQKELIRAWGAVLRVEEHSKKLITQLDEVIKELNDICIQANDLRDEAHRLLKRKGS